MTSVDDMGQIPMMQNMARPIFSDVATIERKHHVWADRQFRSHPDINRHCKFENKDLWMREGC